MEEGNMAAMREALKAFVESVEWLCEGDERGILKRQFGPLLSDSRAALAKPPRNCDRFGGDFKMLHEAWFDWTGSPSGHNPDGTVKMAFGEWLLAPVQRGAGK